MNSRPPPPNITGYCAPEFSAVKQAFFENFAHHGELGASVCVYYKDNPVVDLWGGFRDKDKSLAWQKDTLVCVMSAGKAIASLAVLSLADQGLIDLYSPVAKYWPEFSKAGKENINLDCLLGQLAGIPVADSAPRHSYYEDGVMENALAEQKPLWPPGSTPCYHSFTHGPLCQILVQKATGMKFGKYIQEHLLGPLEIDFYVGLDDAEISRCAEIELCEGIPSLDQMRNKETLLGRAWNPLPIEDNFFNEDRYRRCEHVSANGHSNARALAKLYKTLCNCLNGTSSKPVSKTLLQTAIKEQWNAIEEISHRHFRYAMGFMLNNSHFSIGPNLHSFGHPGLGGQLAYADPKYELGFGYCCNKIHAINDTGPCASNLIAATYASISI